LKIFDLTAQVPSLIDALLPYYCHLVYHFKNIEPFSFLLLLGDGWEKIMVDLCKKI